MQDPSRECLVAAALVENLVEVGTRPETGKIRHLSIVSWLIDLAPFGEEEGLAKPAKGLLSSCNTER